MELSELYNPTKIGAILTKKNDYIVCGTNQAFQTYGKRIELWEKHEERLLCIKAWNSKSILATYIMKPAPIRKYI